MPGSIASRHTGQRRWGRRRFRLWVATGALLLLPCTSVAGSPADAIRAVRADPLWNAWVSALESGPRTVPGACATHDSLGDAAGERHARRAALLASLAERGIEPLAPPSDDGPWPWGTAPRFDLPSAVVDTGNVSILVDAGTITYLNRYGQPEVDPVLAAQAFYAAHHDEYDFLIVFTNFDTQLGGGAFLAYHQAVANDVTGLGYAFTRTNELFDDAARYTGKQGPSRLRSFIHLNDVRDYPADPHAVYFRHYDAVTLLGHEFGHRWLARVRLAVPGVGNTLYLLGRSGTHWSFFFHSGSSPVEGNAWAGDGTSFGTLDVPLAYGALDLYLMGMLAPGEVPPAALWFVRNPSDFAPPTDANGFLWAPTSPPTPGVACTGTQAAFTVDDIALTNGYRLPAYPDAPRDFRAATALVVREPATVTAADLAKLEALQAAFAAWFQTQTGGRGSVDFTLRRVPARIVFRHRPQGHFEDPAQPIPIATQVALEPWSLPTRLDDVRVSLAWSADGGPWSEMPMSSDSLGWFAAAIPPQPLGTSMRYFLRGTSAFPGHEHRWPTAAPDTAFAFRIEPDGQAPTISHAARPSWSPYASPLVLRALVRDPHGVGAVWVESRVDGGDRTTQPMRPVGTTDLYEATLPLPSAGEATVRYRIVARDVSATPHVRTWPASGDAALAVTRALSEDAEIDDGMWTHASLTYAGPDEWHREVVNPISGSYSWKVGPKNNVVPGAIAPRQNSVLLGPAIRVFPGGTLSFRHRYSFLLEEWDPRHYAIDGGIVQWQDVVRDGPTDHWYFIEPDSGYTHTMSVESDSPLINYPVFSGYEPFAREETCTFPPWIVNRTVRFRFRVTTSSPQIRRPAQDGWILDDIRIDPGPPPTTVALEALAGERRAAGVQLAWRAHDASVGDAFTIERAPATLAGDARSVGSPPDMDGQGTFERLGSVPAESGRRDYVFLDAAPLAQAASYRVSLMRGGTLLGAQTVRVDVAWRFRLHPNIPNPFNPTTRIAFELPAEAPVRLIVYDVRGRIVRVLADGPHAPGRHTSEWDGTDGNTRPVASGVYLCELASAGRRAVRRLVLLR